jgi:hypothetical protein
MVVSGYKCLLARGRNGVVFLLTLLCVPAVAGMAGAGKGRSAGMSGG